LAESFGRLAEETGMMVEGRCITVKHSALFFVLEIKGIHKDTITL
jgi:hypothetical protein